MRVIVTGDRNWDDPVTIQNELAKLPPDSTVVHGDCRGADRWAGRLARELGLTVVAWPAEWKKHGRKAGPIRNQEMVDSGADLVLAFHPDLGRSKGTRDCVRRAQRARIQVRVIDGTD